MAVVFNESAYIYLTKPVNWDQSASFFYFTCIAAFVFSRKFFFSTDEIFSNFIADDNFFYCYHSFKNTIQNL